MPRGHRRGGGPRHRWGRRMRIVEPMLLLLMAKKSAHGYGLVEQLASVFGLLELPPQTVYRALQGMEDSGWITAKWDMDAGQGPPRKVYSITSEGLSALQNWADEMEMLRGMLDAFTSHYRKLNE
ncbi:MAG: helix-turn-helix transcriptional regulator [Anaerolineae bacterium]|nr:helix-turn-helix transcriptional regulator [Anaerolineae bacterium]